MFAERFLKKHVSIIHAYSLMTSLQRKIMNVLLHEIVKEVREQGTYSSVLIECRMPLNRLNKAVRFNSNNNQYLKEAIDNLASITIEWNLLKDKVPSDISFLNLRVLHGSPTFYQDGTFNFAFHKVFLDLISNPAVYGTIDLELQSKFESKYAHALYENSSRFVHLQKNKIIDLVTLRKLLGVREDKYSSVREFKRNVICPAIEEVNELADFTVNLEGIKWGRKITGYNLEVKPKSNTKFQVESFISTEKEALSSEILKCFGKISDATLNNILSQYSYSYVLEKIQYTKEHARKEKNALYPIAYFISALKNDYRVVENYLINTKRESSLDQEWQFKLNELHEDLAYWRKKLLEAEANQNFSLIEIEKLNVANCEKALEEHLKNKCAKGHEEMA